jgi:fatty-acyl-CoA synthase
VELNVPRILDAVAARHPGREALLFRDRRITWADLSDRTDRLAAVLHSAGIGIRAPFGSGPRWTSVHDHVALYLHNGNEYLEGMVGTWKARAAPFNVNYRYVRDELIHLLDAADARAVIVHESFTPTLAEVLGTLRRRPSLILQVPDGSGHGLLDGAVDYETALTASDPGDRPASDVWSGDDLYLCFTGGTTGLPKGAMWRQADFLVAALGVRRRDGTEYTTLDEIVDAAHGRVRALPAPPLMHGAAHWNALSCWIAGGTVIIQDHPDAFDAGDVLDAAERHRATSILVVGDPMARPLVDELRRRPRDLTSVRHVLSGGAVLSPGVADELLDLLGDVTIVDVLGSTESGRQAVATSTSGVDGARRFVPSGTTVLLTEDRRGVVPATSDEVGWLAQGGRVPLGYLDDEAATEATFPIVDGERRAVPGDRARWRNDGSIDLLGRDSVCINTGGEKVFAEEVETAIKRHPAVYDAVVCGRPSRRWGSEVVAIVQLRPDHAATDAALRETVAETLARYKVPKAIIRHPAIVRSPSGKADYRWAAAVACEADGDASTH